MSKKILLTGALGQLGIAIRKEYGDAAEFILTDVADAEGVTNLDITDLDAVCQMVSKNKPDLIINCAAFTNVDGCETQEELAFKINAVGPENLAKAASQNDCRFVHISTDYVFSGDGTRPYIESDTPAPVSAYGRTKLIAEQKVVAACPNALIFRTAWLYGEGKNFVRTMLRLSTVKDEISVVCDQLGTPTSAKELARMIHFVEDKGAVGIFHATCEGDTNWADFTDYIFEVKGISCKVNHITSEEYAAMNPTSANRPKYSILENARLKSEYPEYDMADWKTALLDYFKDEND